jgi:hypothetical protein
MCSLTAMSLTKRWQRAALFGLALLAAVSATTSWQTAAACAGGLAVAVAILAYADRGTPTKPR